MINEESNKELDKIKNIEDTIDREKLVYKSTNNTYDFRKFQTIKNFVKDIYDGKISLEEADKNQSDLINEIKDIIYKTRPKSYNKKQEKKMILLTVWLIFQSKRNGS